MVGAFHAADPSKGGAMENFSTTQNGYSRRRMLLLSQTALAAAMPLGLFGYISPANAETGDQADWRFCNKCNGMFWNGTADKGRCPAGDGHIPQGFLFSLHFDSNKAGNKIQYDWRFCSKCRTMFWDGNPNKGRCAAGGGHLAQGLMFGLDFETPPGRTKKIGVSATSAMRFSGMGRRIRVVVPSAAATPHKVTISILRSGMRRPIPARRSPMHWMAPWRLRAVPWKTS